MAKPKRTRRQFLKAAATAAASAWAAPRVIASSALGDATTDGAGERVALGCIGVGGRGGLNMRTLMAHGGQVLAVCDVNRAAREAARNEAEAHYASKTRSGTYKGCAAYNDFREVLARDDVDAVMIATPDHWHVPIALAAVEAGKDVYVEKPLGMTVAECQALRAAVRRRGVVFQHGTEQRARSFVRFACELVRNGRIGEVRSVKVGGPGGVRAAVDPPETPPEGFDYEMWLGPAPRRPFTARCCLQNGHWFISDFAASGFVAGWGIHYLDIVQWALDADETGPVEIDGRGTFPEDGLFDTALTWTIDYTYADGVKVNYTDLTQPGHNPFGIRFEGSEGWIHLTYDGTPEAHPKSVLKSVIGPDEIRLFETDSDDKNFLEAVKSRGPTCSPIDAAHRSTSLCFLGDISLRLGRGLKWDPETERFAGDDEANRMLGGALRTPWRA